MTGKPTHLGQSTVERWYYQAKKTKTDPVGVLRRKVRKDSGRQAARSEPLKQALRARQRALKPK